MEEKIKRVKTQDFDNDLTKNEATFSLNHEEYDFNLVNKITQLRKLSLKVVEIMAMKRKSSYKGIVNDLLSEINKQMQRKFTDVNLKMKGLFLYEKESAIRRRVYDILNVLTAVKLLYKSGPQFENKGERKLIGIFFS